MIQFKNGRISRAITGIAYTGEVCSDYGVAVGEDIPTAFSGVNTMAHELAHVLGAPHDKMPKCPWSEGYLMSYVDGGLKNYRLSECSQERIRNLVNTLPRSCFDERSRTNYMAVYKKYPGQAVRPQHYCRRMLKMRGRRMKVLAQKPESLSRQCKMYCCVQGAHAKACDIITMLEGMECTKGKACRRGVCGDLKW
ncbi:zinc metalloproteinase/disintegrin-like [Dermacentor silvarum]|uniref:zinc metalloproteinase/disintegrin-like n=1 Tax=Dermacentor silvarum TaxID=543639 RepID=UPI0021009B83|nr:zinc metalloproteinase/disintegrin-like [Dermacentor silvarum]